MERYRVWLLRIGLLSALLTFGRCPGMGGDAAAPVAFGRGARAVDGDTVVLADGERLRLLSVDCPETGRPGAEQARDLTQAFLERAGPKALGLSLDPPEPHRDRYGRLLADLRVQGESVSSALVQAGLAWVYRSQDPVLLLDQSRAVALRRGVHAVLDHPICGGPYLLTTNSFHRPGCALVRHRAASLPWAAGAAEPLAAGKAPCRNCLAWPPSPPFGAPRIDSPAGW